MYQATFYDRNLQQKFQVGVSFSGYGLEVSNSNFSAKIESSQLYSVEQKSKEVLVVKIGTDFPFSVLEVNSLDFSERFAKTFSHVKMQKNIEKKGYTVLLTSFLIGFLVLVGAFIFGLPILGEYLATLIPKEQEIKLGESYYQSYQSTFKIDSAKTKAANQIFKIVDFGKEYPLQITVVNEHIKNAFALPGGHIVVYDRIIKDMKSPEEFVALIAHESSHINNRHTTKSIGRAAGRTMVVSWVMGDYASLANMSQEFLGLSYSRELEEDADNTGLQVMIKNKINPKGMIQLFENLKKDSPEESDMLRYISTHPMTEDRIANVEKQISGKYDFPENRSLSEVWKGLK